MKTFELFQEGPKKVNFYKNLSLQKLKISTDLNEINFHTVFDPMQNSEGVYKNF